MGGFALDEDEIQSMKMYDLISKLRIYVNSLPDLSDKTEEEKCKEDTVTIVEGDIKEVLKIIFKESGIEL